MNSHMEVISTLSWKDYLLKVDYLKHSVQEDKKEQLLNISDFLFRGQANADWKLQTTLERHGQNQYSIQRYYRDMDSAHRKIGNVLHEAPSFQPDVIINGDGCFPRWADCLPNYEFMAYLRHHGFPSPLLDWTQSHYIAAFFAFHKPPQNSREVAIFCYQEYCGDGKMSTSLRPRIRSMGHYAAIHPRHLIQQSEYTFCFHQMEGEYRFTSHEDTFAAVEERQDRLVKITIPIAERELAMSELHRMNITPYTIYQTADALLETVSNEIFYHI